MAGRAAHIWLRFSRELLTAKGGEGVEDGAAGGAGDEGERAGCGAGIKTPDKSSKQAGSLAGSQQGVALCRRGKSWGGAEGRDSAGKLTAYRYHSFPYRRTGRTG